MESSQTHLSRMAEWSASLRYEDIPPTALEAARFQLANMAAAALEAARLESVKGVERALSGLGAGSATVLGSGARLSLTHAAMANAAASMAQDFDDIIWMGHTCHSAIWAPLAVAEQEGASTQELLTAIVVANELAGRLGASSFFGPLNGQMWTFIHLIGAAASTAKLLRLDAAQTAHALAISLAQPCFPLQPAFMGSSSKLLAAATPIGTGIQAAYFAKEGMSGSGGLLEDERGFWRRFAFLPLPMMLGELGEFWAIETLTIKSFPGCHYFQTACSALSTLLEGGVTAAQVERLEIESTKLACEVTRFGSEYARLKPLLSPVSVNFDLRATLAVLLHAGRLTGEEVEEGWLKRESAEVLALRERIILKHDPALSMRVLASARALPTGRRALASLKAADLLRLRQAYRREYRSQLLGGGELGGWIRALTGRRGASAAAAEGGAAELRRRTAPATFPSIFRAA